MCLVLELGISSNTEVGISLQPHPLTRFGALTLCIHRHWLSSRLPLASPRCPAPSTPATPPLPLRRRPSPSTLADPLPFPLWRRPLPLPPRRCKPEARRHPFHSGGGPSPSTSTAQAKSKATPPSTPTAAIPLPHWRRRPGSSAGPSLPLFLDLDAVRSSQQKIDLGSFLRF